MNTRIKSKTYNNYNIGITMIKNKTYNIGITMSTVINSSYQNYSQ